VNVYPFIEAEQAGKHNVKRACELLKVSRSAYYQHARGGRSPRESVDQTLTERITAVHEASKGTYGAPRVHAELVANGHRHGRKRVARLMRTAGLRGKCPRRWRTTTIADPAAATRPDLIGRNFAVEAAAVDTRWCGDITYVNTWEGWLYLATVIDLASRRVVGWALAEHLRTDLVDAALTNALVRRRPASGLIIHSDRGCQYTSAQHTRLAARHGVRLSVGRRGQCWDNAVAESFFATIKTELLYRQAWPTRTAARQAIFEYVEGWSGYAGDLGVTRHVVAGSGSPALVRCACMGFDPCLVRSPAGDGGEVVRVGHPLLDAFLELVAARSRPNTVLACAFDLKVFFSVVGKDPVQVDAGDVLAFVAAQREPRRGATVVRIEDGERGLAARTIKRRLATISGLYEYLLVRGDTSVTRNPVPRGLALRRTGARVVRGVPLIRAPRTLPRVIDPDEANAFLAALRTRRDRAMVEAMLLGGLRRCEVLGLRMADVHPGEKRVFIAEGKGGHQRIVPVSGRFFATLASYLDTERPVGADTDRLFVVLKGQRRGRPLTAAGLDEIVAGARRRAGIGHLTCHQMRHTCFTRLREAGMALEAIQAQAGHRSIESTRIYLHLANDWLAGEYRRACEAIDAQTLAGN
jgi:integrase/recombinase XerD